MYELRSTIILCVVILLAACGGGGGDSAPQQPQTSEGSFVDNKIVGLNYVSGDESGVTDDTGSFTYAVGQDIVFSVGAVEIGVVLGSDTITLVDLNNGDSATVSTQNIVRFLLLLDEDNDISNGITISSAVQLLAANWQQVDFSVADLDTELAQIISDIAIADNRTPVLPSAQFAQMQIESTLACLYSGVFSGTFSGDDNGTFLLWIQHQRYAPTVFGDNVPRVGVTSAVGFSTDDNLVFGLFPQQGIAFNSDKQFLSGMVSTGANFSGELTEYDFITNGVWQNLFFNESGTFGGGRLAGESGAVYRLSGFFNLQSNILQGDIFTPDGTGLIALDILSDNNVTGVMVTIRGNQTVLSGTLNGNILTVSGGGNSFNLIFDSDGTDPSNDFALGPTSGFIGEWNSVLGVGGVSGTSCQPN